MQQSQSFSSSSWSPHKELFLNFTKTTVGEEVPSNCLSFGTVTWVIGPCACSLIVLCGSNPMSFLMTSEVLGTTDVIGAPGRGAE